MKLINKFSKGIIAVVVCLLMTTTAWATEQIMVNYTATLDDSVLCVNDLGRTVTLTAEAGETIAMDAFTAQVKAPEGWEITAIGNTKLNSSEFNFNLENGMILWYSSNAENLNNDLLATVTIQIPANTPAGEYVIEFEIIDISRDWGMPWENGKTLTAKLTVAAHEDGGDADHLCDICQGVVEGAVCDYVPGEPVWSDDNKIVTVTGTCACGDTATATAETVTNVTPGNCQTEEITTYTATFTESWITEKTVTKEIKGEMNPDVHVGEQKTEYINNGDDHTVKASYAGCGHVISETNEEHNFTDGDCICGEENNETPEDPIVPAGLKGDVNLDGVVDALDLAIMARVVPGIENLTNAQALINADVNEDGQIDAIDLAKFARFVPGIITDWSQD